MKATETKFLDFLKGPKQFIIPIYQRTYSWTLKQCEQLWKDIIRAGTDETVSGHFVGSIVYIQKGLYHSSSVPQLLVIDGQQRLTTLSLLLVAMGQAISQRGDESDISQKKLYNYFLLNSEEDGDLHYKLLLTQSDKPTLIHLLEGRVLPEPQSKRLVENQRFFEEKISKSSIDLKTLYQGIAKLIIVDISLDHEHDNPQLIFESLNSTGLELSQADLIRNYILMGLEPKAQERLYSNYWYPMEQSFGHADYAAQFDRFMRDYLTVKTGRIPNIREVYEAFKAYALNNRTGSIDEIVADIQRYSKYFVNMALEREPDKELRQAFTDINTLKMDVAYPFFLEVYDDYAQQRLAKDDLLAILRLSESYVFRRAICGILTNSLNKTFATLSKELDKDRYLESYKAALQLKDSYRRFPDDDEFKREFVVKDVYNFRSRNYLLRRLENFDRKECVVVEGFTIEHILPQNQNLSAAWRSDLGENWKETQKRYLHTIGNLTLTGYNEILSDHSFVEKRDMKGGFADSPIRLNKGLGKLERWTETEIQSRAERLADQAMQVWHAAQLPPEVLSQYQRKEKAAGTSQYTLTDHPYLTGEILDLFEQLRRRILNLDSSVTEQILKLYIAYKTTTNFVDVVPQKSRLRLSLNLSFDEINDPQGWCKDVSDKGRWGNGDVEVGLSQPDQLDYVISLIRQSFEKHIENGQD